MILFDTDILIWIERGNVKAASLIDGAVSRAVSAQTYMELLQCASSKAQMRSARDFLKQFRFTVIPIAENISHRACVYIEEYSQGAGLRAGDAIIAATAIEHDLTLVSANIKHYRSIKGLKFKSFRV